MTIFVYILNSHKNNLINNEMAKILTLDEALQEISETKVKSTPIAKIPKEEKTEKVAKAPKKQFKKEPEEKEHKSPTTNKGKVLADAKNVLSFYINKIPDVKIMDQQINIIKKEMIVYSKNKSVENLQKSKDFLDELLKKRNAVNKIFSVTGYSDKDAAKQIEINELIKNSDEIKKLYDERKQLEAELKANTPNSIMGRYRKILKQVKLDKITSGEDVIDFEDFLDGKKKPSSDLLDTEYYNICLYIGNIIGKKVHQVQEMTNNELLFELKNALGDNKEIQSRINAKKMEISSVKDSIAGTITVTDIIHNIFDFETDTTEGKIPKDILAATHVGLVHGIAHKIAQSLGKLHQIDDAVCGGFLGLTVAITSWYRLQRMSDKALSFRDFANIYIVNYSKKALYELSITGTSATNEATMKTRENQRYDDFIKFNPNFAGFEKSFVLEHLEVIDPTGRGINVVSETDYNAVVGGDDGAADIWSINDLDSGEYDPEEAKENYIKLMTSIAKLMDLFETKVNKKTGFVELGNKKMFDKYDRRIFMMYFGLEFKRGGSDNKDANVLKDTFKQEEMAEEIQAMFRADGLLKAGGIPATMSQAGINDRIKKILIKLKTSMDFNPDLKQGFEYLFNYYRANSKSAIADMSNYREEIGISIERAELKEIYLDNEQQLNRELLDGKTLSDTFEITEDNPLDDEIAGLFNDYL